MSDMKIFIVKNRRKTTLEVSSTDTIKDVKNKLQEAMKIPTECQRLSYDGQAFYEDDDSRTLDDIGIKANDIMQVEPFKVYVKHVNWNEGNTVMIDHDIHRNSKVKDVKKIIEVKTNVPVEEQRLVFYDQFMDDDEETLGDNGVDHEDLIDIQDFITISVKHRPTSKLLFELNAEPNDTVYDVKYQIQQTIHMLVEEQDVSCNGKKLEDEEETLRDAGVNNQDTLELHNEIHECEIKVRLPTMEVFSLTNIDPLKDTLNKIKKRIQEIQKIPANRQFLDFMGNNLTKHEKTLIDCNIHNGDMIDLTPHREKLTPVEDMILTIRQQVPARDSTGDDTTYEEICKLKVIPRDTIRDVKKKIQDKTKILMFLQKLSHDGKEFKDDRPTLHYCQLKNGDVIDLVKLPMELKVRVKPGDKTFVITNLDRFDTVGDVKKKVEEKQGIPVDKQNLTHRGNDLPDLDKTLFDLRIKHNAVLILTLDPPKKKEEPPPPPKKKKEKKKKKKDPPPPPPPKPVEKKADGPRANYKYVVNITSKDWCKVNKGHVSDDMGISFIKDEKDGHFYISEVDDDGLAKRFSDPRIDDRLIKLQQKDASTYATVEEVNKRLKEDMTVEIETLHPTKDDSVEVPQNESFEELDLEKGDVVPLKNCDNTDLNGSQAEVMRACKGGKWMVKVLKTGKVMLVSGNQLEVN